MSYVLGDHHPMEITPEAALYVAADDLGLRYEEGFDDGGLALRVADGECDGLGTIISSRVGEGYYPCAGCSACESDDLSC